MINMLGFFANLTSLILWIPQAKKTWNNRNNNTALKGISIGTQVIVIINTILWCLYGLMIKNFWLPLGTIIILPLACFTIYFKFKIRKRVEENKNIYCEKWFSFEMYQKLSLDNKKKCLRAIYTTDFESNLIYEILNPLSYEGMSGLDKMYWNKELWESNKGEII